MQLAGAKQVQLKRRAPGPHGAPMRQTWDLNNEPDPPPPPRRLPRHRPCLPRHRRLGAGEGNPHRLRHLQPGQPRPQGQGLPREGARQGRHQGPLGAVARLQQGARIPQCRLDRFRLDRRRRRADRQDQRQPDQVDLRLFAPRMDRARDPQGHRHHQGRGPEGQARRRDPRHRSAHLPGARPAGGQAHREGREARSAPASGRPHRARARRRRCLGRPRPADGGRRSGERRAAVLPQRRRQHLGRAQRPRGLRQGQSGSRRARAQGL